jgi:hypothetical protein
MGVILHFAREALLNEVIAEARKAEKQRPRP